MHDGLVFHRPVEVECWHGLRLSSLPPPPPRLLAGLGYADLENRVLCKPETVLRIASISKPLTMVAIAKLWEEGKLDLDAPVQKYVPEFPEKEYEGTKVSKAIPKRLGSPVGFWSVT